MTWNRNRLNSLFEKSIMALVRFGWCPSLSSAVPASATNTGAQRLYREFGFGGWETPTFFVTKRL